LREHFSIVALDQRGHGDSDKPESGYEWSRFGDDVLAVVDALELTDAIGIGHSAGATALILAESKRPETFSRLVLLDPTLLPPEFRAAVPGGINPMAEQARRRRAVWDSTDELLERLRARSPLATWREEFLRAYVVHGTKPRADGSVELKCPPEIEALVYAAGPNDAWERLTTIECPTLIVTGQSSPMWGNGRGELAAAQLPNGRWEAVDGGHFFPMERPEETCDLIVPFLTAGE
jgi:pimeloyl-ACP methyl ester carboxylesterase